MRNTRFAYAFAACVVVAGLALSGCVAAPEVTKTPSPQKVVYDAAGRHWFSEPFDPADVSDPASDDAPADAAVTGATTDGVEVGAATDTADSAPDDDVEALPDGNDEIQIQPCSFVGMPAWVRFARDRVAPVTDGSQFELEPGERCVYLEKSDLTRMSVSVYKHTGHAGWLDASSAAHGVPVEALGSGALWLAEYPDPFANTLVAPKPGADAVITIYSFDKRISAADQKASAIEWMKAVLGTTGGR